MADAEADNVLRLIDDAARQQIDRDLGALERLGDEVDRVAGRIVSVAASVAEVRRETVGDVGSDPTTGRTV